MQPLTYRALFIRHEGGVGAAFPDLPGCVSAGDDMQEAARMAEEGEPKEDFVEKQVRVLAPRKGRAPG